MSGWVNGSRPSVSRTVRRAKGPHLEEPLGTDKNGTEFSLKAEVPTCVFGFFEIFEVVPGAGLGGGKENRRGILR